MELYKFATIAMLAFAMGLISHSDASEFPELSDLAYVNNVATMQDANGNILAHQPANTLVRYLESLNLVPLLLEPLYEINKMVVKNEAGEIVDYVPDSIGEELIHYCIHDVSCPLLMNINQLYATQSGDLYVEDSNGNIIDHVVGNGGYYDSI